jgi:Bacterial CdiA-CT RNAse A domain
VPGETAAKVVQTKEPQHKDDFDEWLARIICFAFSVPPQWATKAMNRAIAENQSAQAEEEGLEPTKEWVKDLIDEIVAEEFASPDLELHWLDEDEGAPETVLEGRLKVGALTLNEMRDALGLDPFDNAAADLPMVFTATGFVPIEANAGQQEAGANGQGADAQSAPTVQKYSSDQPRVPAGDPDGGQWTTGDGGSESPSNSSDAAGEGAGHPTRNAARDTGTLTDETKGAPTNSSAHDDSAEVQVAQANDWRNLPVNLVEEEAPNGIGHTIAKHVAQSEAELIAQFPADSYRGWFVDVRRKREGSFDSIENANDLVNQTLRANSHQVDLVASGKFDSDFIEYRFGSVTGYEVYRPDRDHDVFETRKTYGVGVYIWHDGQSPRGFRIRTAYPMNFD